MYQLISEKRNLNNQFCFSFYSIIFSSEPESKINEKIYLSKNVYISTTEITIYFFSIIYIREYMTK